MGKTGCGSSARPRDPVGYTPYPSGVHTVPQWGTHRPPVGYTPSPSGVHTVPQWGTHRPPVGYTPSPSGVHTVPQWGTHRTPVGHPPYPVGYPFPHPVHRRILTLDKGKAIRYSTEPQNPSSKGRRFWRLSVVRACWKSTSDLYRRGS